MDIIKQLKRMIQNNQYSFINLMFFQKALSIEYDFPSVFQLLILETIIFIYI